MRGLCAVRWCPGADERRDEGRAQRCVRACVHAVSLLTDAVDAMLELKPSFIVRPSHKAHICATTLISTPGIQCHKAYPHPQCACVTRAHWPVAVTYGWTACSLPPGAGAVAGALVWRWNLAFAPATQRKGRTDKNQTASRVDKAANRRASKTCDRSRGRRRLCHLEPMAARARTCMCLCVRRARALLSWCRQRASLHA